MSMLTRHPSEYTFRLLGIMPTPRKPAPTLRSSERFDVTVAQMADDVAAAVGSMHRAPVAFAEIAQRDTVVPECVAPRHRKPGVACSDVRRPRRLSFAQIVAGAR